MNKGFMFQQQQPALEENMSNLTSASGDQASASTGNRAENYPQHYFDPSSESTQPAKRKRNLPGNPDPDAEVIALSPKSLLATNRFVCEICNKGFQRDQNLQLHRRGHNLPWKLKQRTNKEVRKKVYVCPEPSCVHHDPSRALGDLTGIKKHFCRKHGEKKWKCEKCSKRYAVQSDWKAHSKICGTREYRCDCGTLFSRRDSFITHRAFCDALAEESARSITANQAVLLSTQQAGSSSSSHVNMHHHHPQFNNPQHAFTLKKEQPSFTLKPADIPPWLACHQPAVGLGAAGPGPPGPPQQQQASNAIDLSSTSSIFSTRIDQEFPHQDLALNQNPNHTQSQTALPFYQASSSPHMSATALLQKAAQMGASMSNDNSSSSSKAAGPSSPAAMNVNIRPHQHSQNQNQGFAPHVSTEASVNNNTTGFGLNLSSRENLSSGYSVQCLSPFGNKAAIPAPFNVHPASTTTAAGGSDYGGTGVSQPPNTFLQDMMTSLSSGFEGTSFEDAFGSVFSSKKDSNLQESLSKATTTTSHISTATTVGNESLTKDFLGLRPLSHSDILNFAGVSGNFNTSQGHQQHQSQNQKPWEG